MNRTVGCAVLVLAGLALGGCPIAAEPTATGVLVSTTLGDFVIELDAVRAPVTVENFLRYVDDGFYDNTLIHRAIPEFVIQGGGHEPGLAEKPTRPAIVNESGNGLLNVRRAVAMALAGEDPDSATSQFFVNLIDNPQLDGSDLIPGFAVFGRVVIGMDVVDAISLVQTVAQGTFDALPVQDVIVLSATRIEIDQAQIDAGEIPRGDPLSDPAVDAYLQNLQYGFFNLIRDVVVQALTNQLIYGDS